MSSAAEKSGDGVLTGIHFIVFYKKASQIPNVTDTLPASRPHCGHHQYYLHMEDVYCLICLYIEDNMTAWMRCLNN